MSDLAPPPKLSPARLSDGFIPLTLDTIRRVELETSAPVEDEIFASLNFVADIKDVGIDFVTKLTGKTGSDAEQSHKLFQAFVRQGQTFFQGAEKLHYRASPLFYYYSFLNFAKAYIALHRPEFFREKVRHGVFHEYDPQKDFINQAVTAAPNGIFPLFYELLTAAPLPKGICFGVLNLLGYMSDIGFEYAQAGYGEHRLLPAKTCGLVKNTSESTSAFWVAIAVHQFETLARHSNALASFHRTFEEVDLNKDLCKSIFGIMPTAKQSFRFFQSRNTTAIDDVGIAGTDLFAPSKKALELTYMPSVFKSEFDFFLAMPLDDARRLRFDELLAGYLIFFYLGDLVRYHPDYLENILFSKESWIIQRFTRSCPTTILRRMAMLLLNENRVYYSR